MTNQFNRRSFVVGSTLLGSAVAAGLPGMASTPSAHARGGTTPPRYGPPTGIAKLNANENPYGPSPAALRATPPGYFGPDEADPVSDGWGRSALAGGRACRSTNGPVAGSRSSLGRHPGTRGIPRCEPGWTAPLHHHVRECTQHFSLEENSFNFFSSASASSSFASVSRLPDL